MGAITQEVNIEMLEKLADGNFKIKYPKTKVEQLIGDIDADFLGGLLPSDYKRIIEGSYVGNGVTGDRFINIGATPKLVILSNQGTVTNGGYFAVIAQGWTFSFSLYSENVLDRNTNVRVVTNGFNVYLPTTGYKFFGNVNTLTYRYIAFI